jgi:hypothetical protein
MKQSLLQHLRDGFADPLPRKEAREVWRDLRVSLGFAATTPRLLTHPSGNTKLNKGAQYGLCLLPHRLSGVNLCPWSTVECRKLCINLSGRGNMPFVQSGRMAKSRLLTQHPDAFARLLMSEVARLPHAAALRLNVFSDLLWEAFAPQLFTIRPDVTFYDYTKAPVGFRTPPDNYNLTFSASERWTDEQIADAVGNGSNVTVVLQLRRKDPMPTMWNGLPVVDGDKNDARYEDPRGVVVGLRAKGKAFRSDSPFVRSA